MEAFRICEIAPLEYNPVVAVCAVPGVKCMCFYVTVYHEVGFFEATVACELVD